MKYIAYYRVSTAQQGKSGLGIEAQKEAVRVFLQGRGWPPVEEFTEVESGKNSDRPKLNDALRACRIHSARLVIAKLDRLARNAAFLLSLRDSGVEFVAVDMPEANRLTVGIMALVAEDEAERISQRTKAALAEAKKQGKKLGNPSNLSNRKLGRSRSIEVRRAKAEIFAGDLDPIIDQIRDSGVTTYSGIARELTRMGIPTARGSSSWSATQVKRVTDRG